MLKYQISSLSLLVCWVVGTVTIIRERPYEGMGPKMFILTDPHSQGMSGCDALHSAFQIDEAIKCGEEPCSTSDDLGKCSRLSQTVNGARVECADLRVNHNYQRGETIFSGEFLLRPPPLARPSLQAGDAIQKALQAFSEQFGLQNGEVDQGLMKFIDGSPPTVFTCSSSLRPEQIKLSYKVDLNHNYFLNRSTAYIDAQNGKTLKIEQNVRSGMQILGNTRTGYYGTKEVTVTQSDDGSTYYASQVNGKKISTFNCVQNDQCPIVANTNNLNFGTMARDEDQLMAAYWGMEQVWDSFYSIFNRTGYDNKGSLIEILGIKLNNSFWSPGEPAQASFGFLTAFDLSTLEIVAHQFMHGVVDTDAGLVRQGESGTIVESICDCIAIYIHSQIRLLYDYWQIGSRTRLFGRSAKDPKKYKQPSAYQGQYWYSGTEDQGGIHQNNGFLNQMFYLLSRGGEGVNEFGREYNIAGISILYGSQVVYRAVTNYLTKNSGYQDYRNAIGKAALDLYGENGQHVAEQAFYAVGIGEEPKPLAQDGQEESSFGVALGPVSAWVSVLLIFALIKHF